ncbi:MAG: hypothetical protein AB1635_18310 [Acidobacteriota bacterium]
MSIAGRYQPLEDPPAAAAPFRARDLATAQTVLLRPVRRLKPAEVVPALERARRAQGIFHPSLITLFDAFEDALAPLVLAYEYVPARTLKVVAGGQPFHPRRAGEIGAEIADAAAELHGRGLAHGAIDGDTVLITAKGKAKLDRLADPSLEGTSAASETGDVAALGRLLMELLTGRRGATAALLGSDAVSSVARRIAAGELDSAALIAATLRRR